MLAQATLSRDQYWDGDFASYIMQAKSIVEGNPESFVEQNRFTMEMSFRQVGPVAYPWGTPFLLSPIYALFGLNMLALKGLNLISYLLFLTVLWIGMHKRLSIQNSLILIFFFAFNPYLLYFLNHVISDIPFLLLSTATLFLIGYVVIEKRRLFTPPIDHILLGILVACSFFIRSNGILLIPSLLVSQIVSLWQNVCSQGHQKSSVTNFLQASPLSLKQINLRNIINGLLPYFIFLLLVIAWREFFPEGGSSHIAFLKLVTPKLIIKNILYYIELAGTIFSGMPLPSLLIGAMLPFLLVGILENYVKDLHILTYVLLTIIIYIVWPANQGLRFIFPILPFILFWVLSGMSQWVSMYGSQKNQLVFKTIMIVFFIVLIGIFVKKSIVQAEKNIRLHRITAEGVFSAKAGNMFRFIREHTDIDDIIIFFKPRIMRLRSGRLSLLIDKSEHISRGNYLCYFSGERPYHQIPASEIQLLISKRRLSKIYSNDLLQFYKINEKN